MTDEELRRIAAERGFALVPRDRIKTVEASVTMVDDASYRGEVEKYAEEYVIENIGHAIAVKLAEFKKLLITMHHGPRGSMVTVNSAKLDVIVPPSPAKESRPRPHVAFGRPATVNDPQPVGGMGIERVPCGNSTRRWGAKRDDDAVT